MTYLVVACGAVAALVAIYMAQPAFPPVRQSAAIFFTHEPAATGRWKFALSPPRPTRLFFLQLLAILLAFLAILSYYFPVSSVPSTELGIWLIVDRSASMSTVQGTATRMQLALTEVRKAVEWPWDVDPCFRISAFDLGLDTVRHEARTAAEALHAVSALEPRALGTDLTLVQRAVGEPRGARPAGCRVDSVIVITDVPAPVWMQEPVSRGDVWIDVSQRVGNIGLTSIEGIRDPFTGRVERVRLQVEGFGGTRDEASLAVEGPDGTMRLEAVVQPWIARVSTHEIVPDTPGRYRISVRPGGAYRYDDTAEIDVPAGTNVRVDWRAGRRDLPAALGWIDDPREADLRVLTAGTPIDDRPTILVGPGYEPRASSVQAISDFLEASPVLDALNFDVAERAGMSGAGALPAGFEPVMRGGDGAVWIAQRASPPAVYLPGLPLDGDGSVARFSTVAFFNAARWVLQRRPIAPLFHLTSRDAPDPAGNRLVLHADEGNTGRTPRSLGALLATSRAGRGADVGRHQLWPWLLLAAIAVFVAERWLAVFRGWR